MDKWPRGAAKDCGIVVVFVSRQQAGKEEIRDDRRKGTIFDDRANIRDETGEDEMETAAKTAAVF